jgi:hypothetical protein
MAFWPEFSGWWFQEFLLDSAGGGSGPRISQMVADKEELVFFDLVPPDFS